MVMLPILAHDHRQLMLTHQLVQPDGSCWLYDCRVIGGEYSQGLAGWTGAQRLMLGYGLYASNKGRNEC